MKTPLESITSERDLLSCLKPQLEQQFTGDRWFLTVENKIIDFELVLPLSDSAKNALETVKLFHPIDEYSFKFTECEFEQNLYIKERIKTVDERVKEGLEKPKIDYEFIDCTFNNKEIKIGNTSKNVTFTGKKKFTEKLILRNSDLKGKIRFRYCKFNEVDFRNTKFNDLADFWNCIFQQKTIFYKTDFYGNVVFSSATFKENVLFTYSLIDKVIIFRGTTFNKGFDISTAIVSGIISYFDVKLNYYKTVPNKDDYEDNISYNAKIPTKNKRETFRILKNNYEKLSNTSESLEMKELEMKTLLDELKHNILVERKLKYIPNFCLLKLNGCSNNYGNSYIRGGLFTLLTGIIFFYLSSINTNKFILDSCFNWDAFIEGSKYFWQFLLPTHRFDYFGATANFKYESLFYFFDFLGRIVVGYGIYQTIQAFRKFR